jgi:hypothetical protein
MEIDSKEEQNIKVTSVTILMTLKKKLVERTAKKGVNG